MYAEANGFLHLQEGVEEEENIEKSSAGRHVSDQTILFNDRVWRETSQQRDYSQAEGGAGGPSSVPASIEVLQGVQNLVFVPGHAKSIAQGRGERRGVGVGTFDFFHGCTSEI